MKETVMNGKWVPFVVAAALFMLAGVFFFVESMPAILGVAFCTIVLCTMAIHGVLRRSRAAKERTRAIVESAADGIITANEHGEIEFMNHAAEEIFGYRQNEMEGFGISTLLTSSYEDK